MRYCKWMKRVPVLFLVLTITASTMLAGCGKADTAPAAAPSDAQEAESDKTVSKTTGEKAVDTQDAKGASQEIASAQDVSELLDEADGLLEEYGPDVYKDDKRADAMAAIEKAIDLYKAAAKSDSPAAGSGIVNAFNQYKEGALDRVLMLLNLETSLELYEECQMELDKVIELGEALSSEGYRVDVKEIESKKESVAEDYKDRIIVKFDEMIAAEHWNIVENEAFAKKAKALFPSKKDNDPINIRYEYAKAWLIHQDVQDAIKAGKVDADEAFDMITEEIAEAGYCEFLMEECEQLAWKFDAHEAYYEKVTDLPVLEESSERDYTKKEITKMHLSPAELRYARLEILARHNIVTLDKDVNKALGLKKGIDVYDFCYYNDFKHNSKDDVNGLNNRERTNLRIIGEIELEAIRDGYFARDF